MNPSFDAADLLGPQGPLSDRLDGFRPRAAQQSMASRVAEALADDGELVVEAGTGVGKTFAYLVPALACGGKVIVSTGTRTLQDQLFHKDLPLVRSALGRGIRAALLKGRANYLCPHRLALAHGQGRFDSRALVAQLHRIERWAESTRTGDIAELADIPEDSALWPWVTSTGDNCLGPECPEYAGCFVAEARRQAQEADIVVVNHHLLLADLALKEEGFGELLPAANAFIIDEAHQLPDVAASYFGTSLGNRQLIELARDTVAEQLRDAPDMPELRNRAQLLERAVAELRLAMGPGQARASWARIGEDTDVVTAVEGLDAALAALYEALEPAAERGRGLEQGLNRCLDLRTRLNRIGHPEAGAVRWYETFQKGFALHLTPLDVAEIFSGHRNARRSAWVFTSATLSVDGCFDHFTGRLGLKEARTESFGSPFDFARNARLYLPRSMPEPNSPAHTRAVIEIALPLIDANPGGTFILFTSHRALREAAEMLAGRINRPLYVQGEAPRRELLDRFREAGDAVLLGAHSFWEGVDVRGRALSCVVIDKLPFASPGDPVLEARIQAIREAGGNPFMEYQVPQAAIALKQGVGRLIRDETDRGVLAICDPRITTKAYGRAFLNSLPPIPVTRDGDEVCAFLTENH